MLVGVIDPDYQGEILLLHKKGKEECVCNTGDSLRHHLVLPYSVIRVNEKLKQPNPGRIANGPNPWGMKVWVSPAGKNHD